MPTPAATFRHPEQLRTPGAGWYLVHAFLFSIAAALLGGFWVEFVWAEAPCRLCLLQRMCMMLAGMGPVWILAHRQTENAVIVWAQGFGISILASVLGMSISLRQILLHIAPYDPGFGSPVLGYHLYSWAFFIFGTVLVCSGGVLLLARQLAVPVNKDGTPRLTQLALWLFGLLILANGLVAGYKAVAVVLAAPN